jgi:hypothetical protein
VFEDVLELLLATKGFEAVVKVLDDAGMFDTYDSRVWDGI